MIAVSTIAVCPPIMPNVSRSQVDWTSSLERTHPRNELERAEDDEDSAECDAEGRDAPALQEDLQRRLGTRLHSRAARRNGEVRGDEGTTPAAPCRTGTVVMRDSLIEDEAALLRLPIKSARGRLLIQGSGAPTRSVRAYATAVASAHV